MWRTWLGVAKKDSVVWVVALERLGLVRRVLFGSEKNGVSKVRDGGGLEFGWWR